MYRVLYPRFGRSVRLHQLLPQESPNHVNQERPQEQYPKEATAELEAAQEVEELLAQRIPYVEYNRRNTKGTSILFRNSYSISENRYQISPTVKDSSNERL